MPAPRTYTRVYWSIVDDPAFERVFDNPHALGVWLRMLLIADAMWPATAPMPPRNPSVRLLIASSLVIERPRNRYTIRGLDAERERRSGKARDAAAMRWQSERNADGMPSRAEPSLAKQPNANASNFMRMRQRETVPADPHDRPVPKHDGRHGRSCLACFPPE